MLSAGRLHYTKENLHFTKAVMCRFSLAHSSLLLESKAIEFISLVSSRRSAGGGSSSYTAFKKKKVEMFLVSNPHKIFCVES